MKTRNKIISLLMMTFALGACNLGAPSTHIVKFETNCSEKIADQEVEHGGLISKPTDPIRTGYSLKAWTYKGDNWSFSEDKVMEDMTLYAKYAPNTYSVRLYNDTSFATVQVVYDKIFNFGIPEGKETLFLGWYYEDRQMTDNKGVGLVPWDIADNVALNAKFIHAETVTLRNVLEFNAETNKPKLFGKQVYARHCKVAAAYDTLMWVEQREGDTLGDLLSVEVRNNKRNFIELCGFGSVVNVLGTIGYEDGRVIMDDAEIIVEMHGAYPDKFDGFNQDTFPLMAPKFSGLIVLGTYQVLDMPKLPMEAGKEHRFKLTFPGCDKRLTNENKTLLEWIIPACVNEREMELLSMNFLNDVQVNDYIKFYSILRYSEKTQNNFQLMYIPSLTINNDLGVKEMKIKNIIDTVDELNEKFIKTHTTTYQEIPSIISYNSIGNNIIFSYSVNESKYDEKNNYKFEIIANTDQSQKVYKDMIASFTKANWTFNNDGQGETSSVMISPTQSNMVGITLTAASVIFTFLTQTPVL